jgi:hypothetical protein
MSRKGGACARTAHAGTSRDDGSAERGASQRRESGPGADSAGKPPLDSACSKLGVFGVAYGQAFAPAHGLLFSLAVGLVALGS